MGEEESGKEGYSSVTNMNPFLKKKLWIINDDLGGSRAPGLIPILEYRLNLNYLNISHYIVRSKNEGLCLAYPLFQVDDEIKQR